MFNDSEPVLSSLHTMHILQSTGKVLAHALGRNLMEITRGHGGDIATFWINEFIISGDNRLTDDVRRL